MNEKISCISPIDGSLYAEREVHSNSAIHLALKNAKNAQKEWAQLKLKDRSFFIKEFLGAMLKNKEKFTTELAWQMGRPVIYGGEFEPFEERVNYCLEIAQTALQPVIPSDVRAGIKRSIKRVPVGVVLVIAPWNYPYLTTVNSIIPALLAGNSVLLKHSNQTLLVGEHFQQAFEAANFPKHLFQNLFMTHAQTEGLIQTGEIDHISFTGSVAGGVAIEKAAAGTFATTIFELGGKDPAYVRADADLNFSVKNLVEGAFYNSGQCCCGIERIYVDASLYDRFLEAFVAETKKLKLGNPLEKESTLGPMANLRFANVVRSQIQEAEAKGAKKLIDPKEYKYQQENTAFLAPQILVEVDHSMQVMQEETFGPVVGIMPVKSDAQAIEFMNLSSYGLTASIWTKDLNEAEKIGDAVDTGTIFLNRCDYLDPGLAWTGTKQTGKGQSLSVLGIQAYTRPKSYHLRFSY